MVACASRSGLIVNDETPTSYLPEPTPAMIESNGAVWNSASRPSFFATSVNRSTSKPMTVSPSSARNSLGAYVVSLPTVMTPSSLTAAGTLAARESSAETLGSGVLLLAPPSPDDDSSDPPPHAASRRAAAVRAATRRTSALEDTAAPPSANAVPRSSRRFRRREALPKVVGRGTKATSGADSRPRACQPLGGLVVSGSGTDGSDVVVGKRVEVSVDVGTSVLDGVGASEVVVV